MDLSRTQLIKKCDTLEELESMIVHLGFNTELLHEQPQIVKDNQGGLKIWQYPNQFSKYLHFLKDLSIESYIEIGCRWGGTFVLTTEFLKLYNNLQKSTAVDLIDSPVEEYCETITHFKKMDSHSETFKTFIKENHYDLIFIDGDHSYQGVKDDFLACKDSGKIFVFHDIISDACQGVVRFWNEMKQEPGYTFHEFTDQYPEVKGNFLGIGVAVKVI